MWSIFKFYFFNNLNINRNINRNNSQQSHVFDKPLIHNHSINYQHFIDNVLKENPYFFSF